MKKIFTVVMLFMLSAAVFGQRVVTKFLGIPVDGSKSAMIQRLEAKGFKYDSRYNSLDGEFNGHNVHIYVVTNNNKVWRIMVGDAVSSSETDIKIRFNNLCRQFQNNKKYVPAVEDGFYLSEDENISYEISVHNKRYEASFYQKATTAKDSVALDNGCKSYLESNYSQEQLSNMDDEQKAKIAEIVASYMDEQLSQRRVWFMISKVNTEYMILMYYDNGFNQSDGEDL